MESISGTRKISGCRKLVEIAFWTVTGIEACANRRNSVAGQPSQKCKTVHFVDQRRRLKGNDIFPED